MKFLNSFFMSESYLIVSFRENWPFENGGHGPKENDDKSAINNSTLDRN